MISHVAIALHNYRLTEITLADKNNFTVQYGESLIYSSLQ